MLITQNEILAKRYRDAYFNSSLEKDYTNRNQSFILSLEDFLKYWWKNKTLLQSSSETLLSPLQSLSIWKAIIPEATPSIVDLAYEAWQLCQKWQIDITHPFFQRSHSTKKWSMWAQAFIKRCEDQHQVDIYAAISKLIQSNTLHRLHLPKTIKLVGFEQPTQKEQQLFFYLAKQGFALQPLVSIDQTKACQIETITFKEPDTELGTMAHWALQTLNANPEASVACVIPDFKTNREAIVSHLENITRALSSQFPFSYYSWTTPFESKALGQHPIVQAALDILHSTHSFHLAALSRLLRSPYIGYFDLEKSARIQLDCFVRRQGSLAISFAQLIEWSKNYHCLYLTHGIKSLEELNPKSEMRASKWSHVWHRQLQNWGWPNLQSLSENEKYYYNQFLKLLNSFDDLDSVISSMKEPEALATLMQHIRYTEVPSQISSSAKKLHLIDAQDARNIDYDQCWVLSANQLDNPNTLEPNPFIPYALQQTIQKTHALSETLKNLQHQSKRLVFSSTKNPLTLTQSFTLPNKELNIEDLKLADYSTNQEKVARSFEWEVFEDDWAPALSQKEVFVGGTDLIKKQAICPFRAFSDYRLSLRSHSLMFPMDIPSYAEKAICLHRILQTIWSQLKNQTTLKQLSEVNLKQLVNNAIHHETQRFVQQKPNTWKPIFTKTEKIRFYRLLHKWLSFEKKRPPFEVKATEYKMSFALGPLELSFVIDRIDQLPDNNLLLIDYKISAQPPALKNWTGTRPIEPQLPLYALSIGNATQAIAWAHLSPELGGKLLGLSLDETHIAGIRSLSKQKASFNWASMLKEWQKTFETLAHQFSNGYAVVNPKEGTISCRHCPYTLLCRIHQPND